MQFKTIFKVLGTLLMIFSLSMLPPVFVALWYQDSSIDPFIAAFSITLITGFLLWLPFRNASRELKIRDGFLVTVLFWLVLSFFGALPFLFSSHLDITLTNAMFESVSGLTTTGSSVLTHLGLLPHAMLYYRQQLQFLGGMGIIVLAVAILPMLGIGGMQLYRAEMPGPTKDTKLVPRIAETAKTLWYIYGGLTVLCALAYWFGGMTPFNAIGESFSTVSTGGFTMHNGSFSYYHSQLIEMIAVFFMLLGGTNFSLHFLFLQRKKLSVYWQDQEFRIYLLFIATVITITAATLLYYGHYSQSHIAITNAIFDVTSLLTTTGFLTGHFSSWPTFIPFLIMAGALVGACGGSTGGGIKLLRGIIAFKLGGAEIKRLIHPRSVVTLKLGKDIIPSSLLQPVWGFLAVYMFSALILLLLLLSQGIDITTAVGAVVAGIANAGVGIGDVAVHFTTFNTFSKWIYIAAMLVGRFEVFTILVLFTPSFWRR